MKTKRPATNRFASPARLGAALVLALMTAAPAHAAGIDLRTFVPSGEVDLTAASADLHPFGGMVQLSGTVAGLTSFEWRLSGIGSDQIYGFVFAPDFRSLGGGGGATGADYDSGWNLYRFTLPYSGYMAFGVESPGGAYDSAMFIRNLEFAQVVSPVPETGTRVMLLAGLVSTAFVVRRKCRPGGSRGIALDFS